MADYLLTAGGDRVKTADGSSYVLVNGTNIVAYGAISSVINEGCISDVIITAGED